MTSVPETPPAIGSVAMIMLGVSDVDRAVAFYRDVLGLKLHGQSEGLAFIDAGDIALALSAPLWHSRETGAGATEVVFTVDDVAAAHAALVARGVDFLESPRAVTPTDWAANFTDPDGHILSLFGPSS
jgi:catechol 2,3-dioxygenase-like lactoylglutathione lyase family enzyme